MNILVCVKRVPATGGKITLTPDEQEIDTKFLGFTVSPHEECAVEEAVRLIEQNGGTVVVLTLGPAEAEEQLRDAMAIGADRGILLLTDGREFDPVATADAIVEVVRAQRESGTTFDILMFGNEAADTGDYQVGVRVAQTLGLPCVTGIKALEVTGGTATARREAAGGWDVFEFPLPAVVTVREGINLPRFPSVPGRLKAKKKEVEHVKPEWRDGGMNKVRLRLPGDQGGQVEILGRGPEAAPKVVEVFRKLGVI